jgi:hypothetical protein
MDFLMFELKGKLKRVFATTVVWIGVILSVYWVIVIQEQPPSFEQLFPVLVGGLLMNLLILTKKKASDSL